MKLALEALEHEAQAGNDDAYRVERDALRAAIEQALEPVACNSCKEWEKVCDQHLRHIKKLKKLKEKNT